MKKTKSIVLIGAATLAAVFFAVAVSTGRDEDASAQIAHDGHEPNLFPFLKPLAGTTPQHAIGGATNDTLIVDADLRRLFDRYLAAATGKPVDMTRAQIEHELRRSLRPGDVQQANHLLRRYLDYRNALADDARIATVGEGVDEAVHLRLADIQRERARFFNTREIEGLFSSDEAVEVDALVRLELGRNRSLRDEQKQEKLLALTMPTEIATTEKSVHDMRANGASEEAVRSARTAALSVEAADRLAQLDRAEAAWSARIGAYFSERDRLRDDSGSVDVIDQSPVLQQLRDARFTVEEQQRLAAYESLRIPQLTQSR